MSDLWCEKAGPIDRLTQGDIIFNCPLVSWSSTPIQLTGSGLSQAFARYFMRVGLPVPIDDAW